MNTGRVAGSAFTACLVAMAVTVVALWPAAPRAQAAGAAAAPAGAGGTTRTALAVDTVIPRGVTVDLVRRTMTLAEGEKRHLRG